MKKYQMNLKSNSLFKQLGNPQGDHGMKKKHTFYNGRSIAILPKKKFSSKISEKKTGAIYVNWFQGRTLLSAIKDGGLFRRSLCQKRNGQSMKTNYCSLWFKKWESKNGSK
jgi:hypothetical protein